MAIPLASLANLAADDLFRARVRSAMIIGAELINNEALNNGGQGPVTYAARHQLATQIINGADGYLDRFAWAVAANSAVQASSGAPPVRIAQSFGVTPCIIATQGNHNLVNGDVVEITGHEDNTAVNGTWSVTLIGGDQFSIPVAATAFGSATGQVAKQSPDADLNTAIASVWNAIAGVGGATATT